MPCFGHAEESCGIREPMLELQLPGTTAAYCNGNRGDGECGRVWEACFPAALQAFENLVELPLLLITELYRGSSSGREQDLYSGRTQCFSQTVNCRCAATTSSPAEVEQSRYTAYFIDIRWFEYCDERIKARSIPSLGTVDVAQGACGTLGAMQLLREKPIQRWVSQTPRRAPWWSATERRPPFAGQTLRRI
jgi:hypothetical protein